ncbi:MAG: fasciclin domain-containing protein [Blastocatellia bacterium]
MPNIVEAAIAANSFTTLVKAVKAAGLAESLSEPGPFTVFAPSDEAFAKLPAGAVADLLEDIPRLKQVLTYHVVAGKTPSEDLMKLSSAKTVEGQDVAITSIVGIKVNDAKVIKADIACDNGVIHTIDAVLTLPAAKSAAS